MRSMRGFEKGYDTSRTHVNNEYYNFPHEGEPARLQTEMKRADR